MKIEDIIFIPEIEYKILKKHHVFDYEIEEAFEQKPLFRWERKGRRPNEHVYSAMSKTESGRYLSIFFIYKRNRSALIISARDMSEKEREYYAKHRR